MKLIMEYTYYDNGKVRGCITIKNNKKNYFKTKSKLFNKIDDVLKWEKKIRNKITEKSNETMILWFLNKVSKKVKTNEKNKRIPRNLR